MKEGDHVVRKSYGGDIVFVIKHIVNDQTVILEGVEYRLIADAPLMDLQMAPSERHEDSVYEERVATMMEWLGEVRKQRTNGGDDDLPNYSYFDVPGKVLHLDGDEKYLERSVNVYKQLKIPVDGYYMEERLMADALTELLPKVRPDIVVITGHDAIIKRNQSNEYLLSSYKNSLHFVRAVKAARDFEKSRDALIIVAGACQSHFEALLQSGANFASSPGRVMIHALDPVHVATKVSYTSIRDTVNMADMIKHTLSGVKGIGGIESKGSYRIGLPGFENFPNKREKTH